MKIKTEKPSPKPTKSNLINNMLAQTLAHIKIKKEVLTEYESESNLTNTPSKSKTKTLKKKMNKSQDENSELLNKTLNIKTELQDMSITEKDKTHSKHKRKSLDRSTTQNVQSEHPNSLNDSAAVTKKSSKKKMDTEESPSMARPKHVRSEHAHISVVDKPLSKSEIKNTTEGQLIINYHDSESEDSDEIHVPKPKQIKQENSPVHKVAGTHRKSSSQSQLQRKATTPEQNSELDSSEEEINVPKPKLIKTEYFNTASETVVNQQRSVLGSSDGAKNSQFSEIASKSSKVKGKPSPKSKISVRQQNSKSDSEVTVPKPIKIKSEGSKSITSHIGSSLRNQVSTNQSNSQSDSSEEEVTVPKPKMVKTEVLTKPSKRKVSLKKHNASQQSLDSGSSDKEVTVPKPKMVKTEVLTKPSKRKVSLKKHNASQQNLDSDSSDEEVTVPKPKLIKTEKSHLSEVITKSRINTKPSPKKNVPVSKTSVTEQNLESESSEEEVTVPKPKNIRSENSDSFKLNVNSVGTKTKPSPRRNRLVTDDYISQQSPVSDSSEEELTVPRPKVKTETFQTKAKSALKAKPSSSSKILSNKHISQQSSSDSSEEEVAVPKPKQMKTEAFNFTKAANKAPVTHQNSESESSEEVTVPKPKKIKSETLMSKAAVREQNSDLDSSDEEITIPKPKKLKYENVLSSSNKKIASNSVARQDNSESDSSEEEVTVPKPKKIKAEELQSFKPKTSASKLAVYQQNSESDSSEEEITVPKPKNIKSEKFTASGKVTKLAEVKTKQSPKTKIVERKQESESESSEEEIRVPKPKQVKTEVSSASKTVAKSSKQNKVSVSDPINRHSSDKEVDALEPKQMHKPNTKNKISLPPSVSESSEETEKEVTVSRSKKVKNKILQSQISHNETTLSTLKQITNAAELIAKSTGIRNKSSPDKHSAGETGRKQLIKNNKYTHETESDNSDDQVMPKPIQIKPEKQMDTPNLHKKRKQIAEINELTSSGVKNGMSASLMIPKEQRNLESWSFTTGNRSDDQSNSESESTSQNIQRHKEDSDSETDMPKPKRIKMEHSNEITQYQGLSWKEKLKYKYPRIEGEQNGNVSLKNSQVISLVLIPKTIDPQLLLNVKIKKDEVQTITLDDKEYVLEPLPKKPGPIVVNINGTRLVEPQNTLCLGKSVPEMSLRQLDVPMKEKVHLPTDLKTRHPLFGFNFKSHLNIDKSVRRQLEEAVEKKTKVEKKEAKKMRKLKRQHESSGVEESVLNMFNAINTTNTSQINETDQNTKSSNVEGHKERKRKRSSNLDDADSVLNNTTKKHKSRKSYESMETLPVLEDHKRKKRKSL